MFHFSDWGLHTRAIEYNARNDYFSDYLEKIKVIIKIFLTRWVVKSISKLNKKTEI